MVSLIRLAATSSQTLRVPVLRPEWRLYSEQSVKYDSEYYTNLVKKNPVVVFMKGTPSSPMCGFSRLVVQILHMHGVDEYDHHDVLQDIEFKEGMKSFSNWPTFPQVYMKGELVGGADILLQLHQNGELIEELEKLGHRSALLDDKHNEK